MPVREVLVLHGIEPHRLHRVRDVEQDSVARAGPRRKTDFGKDGDVVALIRFTTGLNTLRTLTRFGETSDRAGLFVGENPRTVDDLRLRRIRQRDLNDVDAEECRVRVLLRFSARAAGQLLAGTNGAGA